MKINIDLIKSFNPCLDRLDNYSEHYAKKNFTLDQFVELEKITNRDKIWVLCRFLNQDQAVIFCLDAALRCLKLADAHAAAAAHAAHAAHTAAAYAAAYDADAYDAAEKDSVQILFAMIKGYLK